MTAAADVYPSQHHRFDVQQITGGLEHPWGMAFLPDGGILVTERGGQLRLIRDGVLAEEPVSGLPEIATGGQGGLLDVAVDPAYAQNGLVYVSYSEEAEGKTNTAVARGVLKGTQLENVAVIFRALPKTREGSNHYGSRLLFTPDGLLYVTLGERFHFMEEAQNPRNHLGGVVRLNPDGSVPDDNPFSVNSTAAKGLYSFGHRNAQGMIWHPKRQEVWIHEHGPKGGDEINILKPGANYGWPKVTYGVDYTGFKITDRKEHAPEFEAPLYEWTPSIAPSGMSYYDGTAFKNWQGDIFVGALVEEHLQRLRFDEHLQLVEQEKLLEDWGKRIRDVETGPDGALYILTDESDGGLYKLVNAD